MRVNDLALQQAALWYYSTSTESIAVGWRMHRYIIPGQSHRQEASPQIVTEIAPLDRRKTPRASPR